MNESVMGILQESLTRGFVQIGKVDTIRPVVLPGGKKDVVIVVMFNDVECHCSKEEFTKRSIDKLTGFIGTMVPFIVKNITSDGRVIVSRVQAIPKVTKRFLRTVEEGDIVKGTVTGVASNGLIFVEVQGFPCLIPPNEWDTKFTANLAAVIPVGMEISAKVISISEIDEKTNKDTDDSGEGVESSVNAKVQDVDFEYRIRLSRKAVMNQELEEIWNDIEKYYSENDTTEAKIVGFAKGHGAYFLELPKKIVIIGFLTTGLRRQYGSQLPAGLKVHAQIRDMDKAKRQGRARITRIDPTISHSMSSYGY